MHMETKRIEIKYREYSSKAELPAADAALLAKAEEMTGHSYAPYSGFHVGAAVQMSGGQVFGGSNQENAAFPSGLCAERTAIYYAAAQCPNQDVVAVAIAAEYNGKPAEGIPSPCGACRQAMVQYEQKSGKPIRVILGGSDKILVFDSVADLLPLVFDCI